MDETRFVPVAEFATVVKLLFSQMVDLAAGNMVLRQALMQQKSLPLQAEELQRLHKFFQDEFEPFQKAKQALEQAHTAIEIQELLRIYKLPGQ